MGFLPALDSPGILALHRPSGAGTRAYVLPDNTGVIFGSLFSAQTDRPPQAIDRLPKSVDGPLLHATRGRYLVDNYWGHYAAFFSHRASGTEYAMRDCSGKVPCMRAEANGVQVCFSYFEDALSLGILPPLRINERLLSAYLCCTEPHTNDCGFEQVTQLLAGETVGSTRGERTNWFSWNPREICGSDPIRDESYAKLELRRLTQWCVDAHALRDRSVILNLSGGFDSAVLLGCLQRTPHAPALMCMTRYSSGPGEDERAYARLAASEASVGLVERDWRDAGVAYDARLFDSPTLARPSLHILSFLDHRYRSRTAAELGATSIWNGEGGDHLFIRGLAVPFSADYASDHGINVDVMRYVAKNARYSGISYWESLRQTFSSSRTAAAYAGNPLNTPDDGVFVSRAVASGATRRDIAHPWCLDLSNVPKGKQWQIQEMAELLNRGPTMIVREVHENPPLLSQPLMSLSLRIPTYILLKDGLHRGLARDAFSDLVPQPIRDRESKGNTNSVVGRLLSENRIYIRELLLDGLLARRQLIARDTLDRATSPGKPLALRHMFPLMSTLAAEIWLRKAEQICHRPALKAVGM